MRIERHAKVKGEANPYDPEWETYYEKRLDIQMSRHLERETTGLSTYGKSKKDSAQSANRKSPRSRDGTVIT